MATALYKHALDAMLKGELDWVNDDVRGALVNTSTYTVDIDNDSSYGDLDGVVDTTTSLQNKTVSGGKADSDDITFEDVTGTGDAVVLYKEGGVLIIYMDNIDGLPITSNSADLVVRFHEDGVFQL